MKVRRSFILLLAWALPPLLLIAAWQVWDFVEARRFADAAARAQARPPVAGAIVRDNSGWDADEAGRFYAAAAIAYQSPFAPAPASVVTVIEEYRAAARAGTQPSASTMAVAKRWLQENEATLRLIDEGAPLEFRGFSAGTSFNYRTTTLSLMDRVASVHTLDLLVAGDIDAAADSLVTRLRAVRTFTANPSALFAVNAVSDIVDDAAVVLSRANAPATAAARVEMALRELNTDAWLSMMAADLEQTYSSTFARAFDGGLNTRSTREALVALVARPLMRRQAVAFLEGSGAAVEAARLPWPQRLVTVREIQMPMVSFPGRPALTGGNVSWFERIAPYLASLTAHVRSMHTVLGVDRYQRSHAALPPSLAAVTDVDAELMQDPFTGGSLMFRATPDGFVVYSVGEDGRDDGGAVEGTRRQPGERVSTPSDVGVRFSLR